VARSAESPATTRQCPFSNLTSVTTTSNPEFSYRAVVVGLLPKASRCLRIGLRRCKPCERVCAT
jgi:hypothetical protein